MEFDKISEIICSQLNLKSEQITENTSLNDDLGADSLDIFQIVLEIEETFGIEIANTQAEQLKTVGDIIGYIKSVNS